MSMIKVGRHTELDALATRPLVLIVILSHYAIEQSGPLPRTSAEWMKHIGSLVNVGRFFPAPHCKPEVDLGPIVTISPCRVDTSERPAAA